MEKRHGAALGSALPGVMETGASALGQTSTWDGGSGVNCFVIDTTAFGNLPNPTGVATFELIPTGNDISLSYSPVPEPASVLAFTTVALGGAWFRRRFGRPV